MLTTHCLLAIGSKPRAITLATLINVAVEQDLHILCSERLARDLSWLPWLVRTHRSDGQVIFQSVPFSVTDCNQAMKLHRALVVADTHFDENADLYLIEPTKSELATAMLLQ